MDDTSLAVVVGVQGTECLHFRTSKCFLPSTYLGRVRIAGYSFKIWGLGFFYEGVFFTGRGEEPFVGTSRKGRTLTLTWRHCSALGLLSVDQSPLHLLRSVPTQRHGLHILVVGEHPPLSNTPVPESTTAST